MDKIAVLIPCYNESLTVSKVVSDWKKVLPEAVIYVYDYNSSDGTDQLARDAGAVVRYERQQGKGNVIRRMFREIDACVYFMVDGDDTYPADCAEEMADLVLTKQVDMVIGDRLSSTYFEENKRLFHNFGNTIVRWSINSLFHSDVRDVMTGCRAFSYEFVKTFPVLSKGFEIETEMTIHALDKNMRIGHVVIPYRDRPKGSESKLNTVSDGMKVLKTIAKLFRFYKPASFYGLIGIALFLIAVGCFIPLPSLYDRAGLAQSLPLFAISAFSSAAALLSFFSGLMMQDAARKNRQDFEMLRNRTNRDYKELLEREKELDDAETY